MTGYPSFPAAGRPMEFMGLTGPWILAAAGALLIDFLLFVIAFCAGLVPGYCILLALGLGAAAIAAVLTLSKRFGAHGLAKHLAARRLPQGIRFDCRNIFITLKKEKQ